jgi:8-oxo-dGTP pyrophosphatase MutT (NUDIX family)
VDPTRPDPTSSPWRTRSSREVYRNQWMRLREDEVVTPTGTDGVYAVVEKTCALGVVAVDDEDRVVLVGQWRYPLDRYSWEVVEGGLDEGEEPLAGIQRELAEEAGLGADEWHELTTAPLALSNSVMDEEARLWLATGLRPVEVASDDPTELLQVTRVPFDEVLEACLDGRIDDSLTLLAVFLADQHRRRRGSD